jgi:hypothetical protein
MKTIITCAALGLLIAANVHAQKLPGKQEKSVRAPANLKIDGMATEWDNKFQAHNNATEISYTLSNDDEKLYLTVRTTYHDVIDKILRGGITFKINHTLKKKEEKPVAVTYPFIRGEDILVISNFFAHKTNEKRDAGNAPFTVTDLNEMLGKSDKLINVTGVEDVPEPQISIYNATGIKAASKFDETLAYTFELAIPLKYLALPNNGSDAFSYQIKVNEPAGIKRPTGSMAPPPPPMNADMIADTDFWGEYTLAK